MTQSMIPVGMAEVKVAKPGEVLSALGLGSCIGLAAYCRRTKIAGMVHIMLPAAFANQVNDKPGKFADSGVPALLEAMKKAGAGQLLTFAYSGGAQVFSGSGKAGMDIGARNAEAVAAHLKSLGVRVQAFEVGGNEGRTMTLDPSTGKVTVRSVRTGTRELCNLAG